MGLVHLLPSMGSVAQARALKPDACGARRQVWKAGGCWVPGREWCGLRGPGEGLAHEKGAAATQLQLYTAVWEDRLRVARSFWVCKNVKTSEF